MKRSLAVGTCIAGVALGTWFTSSRAEPEPIVEAVESTPEAVESTPEAYSPEEYYDEYGDDEERIYQEEWYPDYL